jgi:hypothetical protein
VDPRLKTIAETVAREVAELFFSGYDHADAALAMGRSIAQRDLNLMVVDGFNGGRDVLLDKDIILSIELWDKGEVLTEIRWAQGEIGYQAKAEVVS